MKSSPSVTSRSRLNKGIRDGGGSSSGIQWLCDTPRTWTCDRRQRSSADSGFCCSMWQSLELRRSSSVFRVETIQNRIKTKHYRLLWCCWTWRWHHQGWGEDNICRSSKLCRRNSSIQMFSDEGKCLKALSPTCHSSWAVTFIIQKHYKDFKELSPNHTESQRRITTETWLCASVYYFCLILGYNPSQFCLILTTLNWGSRRNIKNNFESTNEHPATHPINFV